jgi:hypothetical protein
VGDDSERFGVHILRSLRQTCTVTIWIFGTVNLVMTGG